MYVNPEGISSECPICGGKVKHPAWKMSRCENCGLDYDGDRLASLAISLRGLDLCGEPFPMNTTASVPSRMGPRWHTLRTMLSVTIHNVSRTANKESNRFLSDG